MIHGAVPAGSVRASGQVAYLAAVRANQKLAHFRADRWDSTWKVAQALALHTDWQLGTNRAGWDELAASSGVPRRTLARRLVDLREAGLLGIVATGRTAGTDPNDPDAANMAAVYVLAVPHALRPLTSPPRRPTPPPAPTTAPATGRAQDGAHPPVDNPHDHGQADEPSTSYSPLTRPDTPVDKNGTPSLSPSVTAKEKPPHARASQTKIHHERASSPSAIRGLTRAQLLAAGQLCAGTEKALWTKERRLLAAGELCRLDPVLGRLSVADVASLCREWFLAGYSVRDILTAINTRPDGTPWPHQLTVAAIVDVRGWTRHRLNAWRTYPLDPTSPPGRSHSARVEAEQTHAAARAVARTAAAATERAARMPVEDRPPAVEAALAAARALLRHHQLTRKHR